MNEKTKNTDPVIVYKKGNMAVLYVPGHGIQYNVQEIGFASIFKHPTFNSLAAAKFYVDERAK